MRTIGRMNLSKLQDELAQLQEKLGYTFQETKHLIGACIHSSYVNENKDEVKGHNERHEFLGDSVLGLIVAEELYLRLPDEPEGSLSRLKAALVEAEACVRYVETLGIESYLVLGKGEAQNQGRGHQTILADFFEAVMAAIYLDGGYGACRSFFLKHFSDLIEVGIESPEKNAKVRLQDLIQKEFKEPPEYKVLSEEGPGHEREFTVAVYVKDEEVGRGVGHSKKDAQNEAARVALEKYGES